MLTCLLIRHAENEHPERLAGRLPGFHLSTAGSSQAAELARRLRSLELDAVCSSPLARAHETAVVLAEATGHTVEVWEALQEIDLGEWEGRTFDDLEQEASWRRFHHFRAGSRPPGGESLAELQARLLGAMEEMRARWPNGRTAVVSHGDPIRVVLAAFTGVPLELAGRIPVAHASVSVVQLGADQARVLTIGSPLDLQSIL